MLTICVARYNKTFKGEKKIKKKKEERNEFQMECNQTIVPSSMCNLQ